MIEFIPAEKQPETVPSFKDVKINQFFINSGGSLCQKRSFNTYSLIADSSGTPYSDWIGPIGDYNYPIRKILPTIAQIKFE